MEWQFLRDAAQKKFEKNEDITIVMGNESTDIDSAVCSIVYAYLKQSLSAIMNENKRFIPVLNMSSEDKILKTEVFFFLEKYGVPIDSLHFRDTIDLKNLTLCTPRLEIILVDHHGIPEEDLWLKSHVAEVIDHRPLDPDWSWKNTHKTIESVASCATLIAEKVLHQNAVMIPRNMLILLYGTILYDTWSFEESVKLYTEKDKRITEELESKINFPCFMDLLEEENLIDRDKLFKDLLSVRCNVRNLTVPQILRKDLKITCGVPIPVLPILVQEFLKGISVEELPKFTHDFGYKGLILIGVTFDGGIYAQDIGVFSEDKYFMESMAETLAASKDPDLQLNEVSEYANMKYMKVYKQNNVRVTRKQILPIVKEFMKKFLSSPTDN